MFGFSRLELTSCSKACALKLTALTAAISACFALPGISCSERSYLTYPFQFRSCPFSAHCLIFIRAVARCRVTSETVELIDALRTGSIYVRAEAGECQRVWLIRYRLASTIEVVGTGHGSDI